MVGYWCGGGGVCYGVLYYVGYFGKVDVVVVVGECVGVGYLVYVGVYVVGVVGW